MSKYVTISEDGKVEKDPNSTKLIYGGLLTVRVHIHYTVHYTIAKMATIGARYSFLRRQFNDKENQNETLVMQYQMQQLKIVPAIAAAWAHLITNLSLEQQEKLYKAELEKKSKKAFEIL
jgi:spore germination cell wall hydrolase CwlJ-like protein